MIKSTTVTSAAAVNVFTAPTIPTTTFRCRQVVIQNTGPANVRLSFGGSASGTLDVPTSSAGYQLLPGAAISFSDTLPSNIDAISEGANSTIQAVTD